LLTAERADEMCLTPELTLVTLEEAPLALFGAETSRALATRLADAGVTVVAGTCTEILSSRLVELQPRGRRLTVDRVVTLPTYEGPGGTGTPP
jgi:hypothetical protein